MQDQAESAHTVDMDRDRHFYEKVTFRPEGGRARTIFIHRPHVADSPVLGETLSGVEVDREGDAVSGARFDERRHVISTECVIKRIPMRMDNTHGELVEVDP